MKGTLDLQPADMMLDMQATTKAGLLAELSGRLTESHPEVSQSELLRLLQERESLGSTGIGEGVAIPHCKLPTLKEPILVFGRSKAGVDFRAIDGRPVHLFFLLVAPEGAAGLHLKLLARLSRLLKDQSVRMRLFSVQAPEEISGIIKGEV